MSKDRQREMLLRTLPASLREEFRQGEVRSARCSGAHLGGHVYQVKSLNKCFWPWRAM